MKKLQILILMLLISYGSIGAVTFVSGLPLIAKYFSISSNNANYTITLYLLGYAFGQLIYGPLTNRFGIRQSLRIGSVISIIGTIVAISSYYLKLYIVLVIARCIMALGAACGLKMAFTLSSELYTHKESARIMGLLTIAFAITPSIGIYLGSLTITMLNWTGSFYIMIVYSTIVLLLINKLPAYLDSKCCARLNLKSILLGYFYQLKCYRIILGGLLVGIGSCFVYIFAAVAPFIVMNQMHLSSEVFGYYSFIPSIGMVIGSILANHYGKKSNPEKCLFVGIIIALIGGAIMAVCYFALLKYALGLFIPMIIIYMGLSFIFGNAAAISMKNVTDKSNASAMMSFINMISAVVIVTIIGILGLYSQLDLIMIYFILIILGFIWFGLLMKVRANENIYHYIKN